MRKKNFFQFEKLNREKNLIHGFFDKSFGNINFRYGHRQEVLENRRKMVQLLKIKTEDIYEMDQVHGSSARVLELESLRVLRGNIVPKTDGLTTNLKGVFLMVKTADCFPVLFFDPVKKVVAACHVGWRGAIEKIFFAVLLKMINFFDCRPINILVGIGPGIKSCCFRHKNLIQNKLPEWEEFIKKEKNGWLSVDIRGFIEDQLVFAGVKKENIETVDICTGCSKEFFSHLRSLQLSQLDEPEGRFATIIGLRA